MTDTTLKSDRSSFAESPPCDPLQCQYCQNKFSSKYKLERHQQTAKYCILIQMSTSANDLRDDNDIHCQYCVYRTKFKSNLTRHLITCKNKKEQEAKIDQDKDLKIAILETKLECAEKEAA